MPPILRQLTIVHAPPEEGLPPWHRHDVHELLYVVRGRYEVDALGARREGGRGWLFCHPAGRPHRPRFRGGGRGGLLEGVLLQWEEDGADPWPYPLAHHDASGRIFAALDWMLDAQRRDTPESLGIRDRLLGPLLTELSATTDRRQFLLLSVHTFIEDNLARPLAVTDLADAAGLSRYHFIRQFREVAGQTPMRYAMERRLDAAARLLRGTDLPLADIAGRTGFCSPFHLSRRFKARTGLAPRAWRRQAGTPPTPPDGAPPLGSQRSRS